MKVEKLLNMDRINAIINHALWQEKYHELTELENERIFCRHNISHFMDVARLAYIESLELGLGISKELIYAVALLHDIGRGMEYTHNIPHEKASADIANIILKDCGFSVEEMHIIKSAILSHRSADTANQQDICGIIYRADKKSRMCRFCTAESLCNWSKNKKNMHIKV